MRILIVRLGAIGDVVHTLPAVAAIRRAFPGSYLAWAVENGGAAKLLDKTPCVDRVIGLDLRGWRKRLSNKTTYGEIRSSIRDLRDQNFDLSLDFQGLYKSAMIPWLARVPRRIGFNRASMREPGSARLLTEEVPVNDRQHVINKNLQLIGHLGIHKTGRHEFPIHLDPADREYAKEQLDRHSGSYAILNPGGGWPTKIWAPENFAEIANRLWNEFGIHSLVTYGPGEEKLARSVMDNAHGGAATMLESSLKQFFAAAQAARIFVGGDTGPMHLAAAAGTPIVSIFGPTNPERNGPFALEDIVIERFDLDCRIDCYRRSCSHTSCMLIPVETVWQGVVQRLHSASGESEILKTERVTI